MMLDTEHVLEQMRAANPAPSLEQLTVNDLDRVRTIVARERSALLHAPTPPLAKPQPIARGRRPAAWVFVAVLVAVLVAIGIPVWLGSGGDPGTSTEPDVATTITTPPTTVPPTPTAPAEVVPFPLPELEVPLSEAVPGFTDTIVWSATDNGLGVMRWHPSESIAELLLPPPAFYDSGVGLDASAHWVGQVQVSFGAYELAVHALPTGPGEPSRPEIVGPNVQGAAVWHDTEPGQLAWLECPNSSFSSLDGPTTLVTLDVSDPSADPIRVLSFDDGCRMGCWGLDELGLTEPCVTLVRWGSTGVWVTKYSENWETKFEDTREHDVMESVLVDADGAEIATVSDALMIAMSPDGTSVWRSDNWRGPSFVLSPDGRQRSTLPGLDYGEHLLGAWWSADGTRLAMRLGTGIRIVDSASGEVITEIAAFHLDPYGPSVAWSTDSRFLVYEELHPPENPDNAVLVIHDTATNTTTKIPIPGDVNHIRVR